MKSSEVSAAGVEYSDGNHSTGRGLIVALAIAWCLVAVAGIFKVLG